MFWDLFKKVKLGKHVTDAGEHACVYFEFKDLKIASNGTSSKWIKFFNSKFECYSVKEVPEIRNFSTLQIISNKNKNILIEEDNQYVLKLFMKYREDRGFKDIEALECKLRMLRALVEISRSDKITSIFLFKDPDEFVSTTEYMYFGDRPEKERSKAIDEVIQINKFFESKEFTETLVTISTNNDVCRDIDLSLEILENKGKEGLIKYWEIKDESLVDMIYNPEKYY